MSEFSPAPKPSPREKKPKRALPRTQKSPGRKSKPKAVNRKRRSSEWVRAYGSKARVEWVKARKCVVPWCGKSPCENAHSENGGAGRKGDAFTIAPLCRAHHREMHDEGRVFYTGESPFTHDFTLDDFRAFAALTEWAWSSYREAKE